MAASAELFAKLFNIIVNSGRYDLNRVFPAADLVYSGGFVL